MSNRDSDWQRPANPDTSVAGIAQQRPAKPIGSTGDLMALAVGIWYVTHSWRGLPAMKSASGAGAGARERVRWATGSRAGRLRGELGNGIWGEDPTLGEGVPVKSRHRGVAWKGAWTIVGDRNIEPAGLGSGLHDGLATIGWAGVGGEGDTTLGGSCVGTLGWPGIGIRGGWKEGVASSCHDSKISRR